MSVNLILVKGGKKIALPITSEAEYRRLRDTSAQQANLRLARQGNQAAKRRLIQFNYSGYYPQGVVKGCKLPSQAFGFDIDDPKEFERVAHLLLDSNTVPVSGKTAQPFAGDSATKDSATKEQTLAQQLGLLMLERSASQGGHAVFEREKGKTILENQVRIAQALDCELDTNAHDVNRVYFSTTAHEGELLFLSPQLFADRYGMSPGADKQSVEEEARTLEDRERWGREELPPGAHSANKHFKPYAAQNNPNIQNPNSNDSSNPNHPVAQAANQSSGSVHHPAHPLSNPLLSAPTHVGGALDAAHLGASPVAQGSASSPIEGSASSPLEGQNEGSVSSPMEGQQAPQSGLSYLGIPYSLIITKWWQMYNSGLTPVKSNRDVLTFELAVNLRHICGFDRQLMDQVIPCYDGFSEQEKMKCIDSALSEKRTQMPRRLRDLLSALKADFLASPDLVESGRIIDALDEAGQQDDLYFYHQLPPLPQGVSDSVDAAGRPLCMATLIAIAPAIGTLATGVKLDVHGTPRGLNLISYICGEFGSGKGQLDPIVAAWMSELQQQADIYTQQEEEWAQKTRRMKSGKAPEQPKLPVRILPLNNTLANIAERLSNTQGKHSFSFTPEADTVAVKWKSSMSDFSVMLRQAYDGSRYDREAKSADAVRVHIPQLLWNVTMCGTQDALYRVVTNYTDGLLSRIAIARTPDNTFAPLSDHPATLSEYQAERIKQIAHLLPLMEGTVVLDRLEQQGRNWLERIRLEAMKNDDRVLARQRLRGCVNAQRITCALWLAKVAAQLLKKHGMAGSEKLLRANPDLWKQMLQKLQSPDMLKLFDLIADYLIDTDLFYFRSKIEAAYESKNYTLGSGRSYRGKNDSIFSRLDQEFTSEQAMQQSIAVKGVNTTTNSVKQMLKNWRKQGLIVCVEDRPGAFRKLGAVKA